MSTNLLYNPNFDSPLITTNTYKLYTDFTPAEITAFYWSSVNYNNIAILNGVNDYGYPSPSLINCTQAISLQNTSDISQTVTIFDLVNYQLKFNYTGRPNPNNFFVFNPLDVFINNVLVYTVSTYITTWSEITIDYTPTDFGSCVIQFKTYINGLGQDQNICLTNIKFYQKQTTGGGGAPAPSSKMVSYNSLKNTNIYGYLNVNDYIVGSSITEGILRTPKLILNKTDIGITLYTQNVRASTALYINNVNLSTTFTTQTLNTTTLNLNGVNLNTSLTTTTLNATTLNTNIINYNYSAIPTFTATNLGYITTLNYTGSTSIASSGFANLSASLGIGIYIINAYALFTITTINTNSRVGMNTVINTVNTTYNYSQTLNATATLPQAMQYNFILQNNATTLYYFYFNSGSAATLTKFQVNILRIA